MKAYQAQEGRCFYCGREMWTDDQDGFARRAGIPRALAGRFQCTAEHLMARCDGGGGGAGNIVAACRFCNVTRHRRRRPLAPVQYLAHVQRRLEAGRWHPG